MSIESTTADAPSALPGGTKVILRLFKRAFDLEPTAEQAAALWAEVKGHLEKVGLDSTVRECDESETGGLDTLPRGDVMSALGHILAGRDWPANYEGDKVFDEFVEGLKVGLRQRSLIPDAPQAA